MAILYTPAEMQRALRQLKIKDEGGTVTGKEVAAIWSWRARREQGVVHTYRDSAARERVYQEQLEPVNEGKRPSRYKVEDVFHISLTPNRAKSHLAKQNGATPTIKVRVRRVRADMPQ